MTQHLRTRPVLALLLLACLPLADTVAGGSRTFDLSRFDTVDGLQLDGAATTFDGGIVAGPAVKALVGPSVPVLWKVVPVDGGGAFAVGGSPATVLFLPESGEGRRLVELGDGEITAAVARPDGTLTVAVAPGGRLLDVNREGALVERGRTGTRYVWDMHLEEDGTLWVAAGVPGALLRYGPDGGEPVRVMDLGQNQARCLAPHPDGGMLVGISGSGQVRLIGSDGRVRVLHDDDLHEIVAVDVDADGSILAAAVARSASIIPQAGNAATPPGRGPEAPQPGGAARPPVKGAGAARKSRVVSIAADGVVRELWRSDAVIALDVLPRRDGSVWLGLSRDGAIIRLGSRGDTARLAELPSQSVTSLVGGPDGRVWASTGGLGLVVVLDPSAETTGLVVGQPLDAGAGARFGRLEWWSRADGEEGIEMAVRSGQTRMPDDTWSMWSSWSGDGTIEAPASPPGRFIQWRARLRRDRRGAAPELARLRIAYLPVNRAPRIKSVEVLPAGVALEPLPVPPGQGAAPPGSEAAAALAGGAAASGPQKPRTRRQFRVGRRTVTWSASDEDGDRMAADLWIRGDDVDSWSQLGTGVENGFLVFEESLLPDGGYTVRVEVSDLLDNGPARARATRRRSDRFVVDRTPPVVESLRHESRRGVDVIRLAVSDGGGAPQLVEVRVDDGAVVALLPDDGIADQTPEDYRVELPDLPAGSHRVSVRVTDQAGNVVSARIEFVTQE